MLQYLMADTYEEAVNKQVDQRAQKDGALTPVLITLALKCFASVLAGHLKQPDILVPFRTFTSHPHQRHSSDHSPSATRIISLLTLEEAEEEEALALLAAEDAQSSEGSLRPSGA
ncbi:hypothetical protein G5714_023104 [Onychostoma macrolepis]|uniref:Uncharacterized protein n=1 Tax=Onychostoma macrolepis TaxID=369639 RepID=A0A7J6BLH5_9TELE|nr:hypothetical protein G5714_023104 [Onychostoma macrolepis]